MPEGSGPLQQRAELKVQGSRMRALAWHPTAAGSAATVEDRSVVQWCFEGASAEVGLTADVPDLQDACRLVHLSLQR
jgi:hypothetical protein